MGWQQLPQQALEVSFLLPRTLTAGSSTVLLRTCMTWSPLRWMMQDSRPILWSPGTGAAQQHLLPALMHVYSRADAVVGLDVDRDSFDKFRCEISLLLSVRYCQPTLCKNKRASMVNMLNRSQREAKYWQCALLKPLCPALCMSRP